MTPIAPLMKPFFAHYLPIQRGLSAHTIASYCDAVRLLLRYRADTLGQSVDALHIEDLSAEAVLAFLDHLEDQRQCTAQTRNSRLAAVRSLFAFFGRQDPELLAQCQQVRAIPLKRTSTRPVDYLEECEMHALLNAIDPASRTGARDRALLMLLYNTGARVSEVAALNLQSLRLQGQFQVELQGKGSKSRTCPLWPETIAAIKNYLNQRDPAQLNEPRLLLNANGAPITRFGIRYIVTKYAAEATAHCPSLANKNVTVHTLRHTTAMHLLRAGNDIVTVSYWLGHADINTTHVYLEIDMEMKRQMLDKAPPPSLADPPPWKQPGIIEWLNQLQRNPELCAARSQRIPVNTPHEANHFT